MEVEETNKVSEEPPAKGEPPGGPVESGLLPRLNDQGAKTWAVAAFLLAVVLILHVLAYYLLPGWLWGADTLYPLAGGSVVALLVLGLLSLWPGLALAVLGALAKLWDRSPRWAFRDVIVAAALTGAVAGILLWRLGVSDPAAGAWLFHSPYAVTSQGLAATPHSMPILVQAAMVALARAIDVGYAQATRGAAVGLGIAFCCLALFIPVRRGTGEKMSVGFLLVLSGAALVFISPRADLAFEALATAAFVLLGLASLEGSVSPFFSGVVACCACVVHPIGLALLPAWAVLMMLRAERARARAFLVALIGSAAVVALALIIVNVALGGALEQMGRAVKSIWATGSGARAEWALGLAKGEGAQPSALGVAGWLVERVWGTFNGLLFVAPAGLALAVAAVVARSWRRGSPALAFLGLAAIITGVFAFAAAPYYGPPRSWGMYVPFGVCVTVFAAWWLAQQLAGGPRFKALALSAVVISLMHLMPPLFSSRQVLMGAERLSWLATASSPWDVRGRAAALEELAGFYLAEGDTLTAAEQLGEAWKVRRNPLYLGAAGTYYAGMKRYDLAELQFAALVKARPFDRQANLSLGIVCALNGNLDKAKRYFLEAYGDTSLALPEPQMDSQDWVNWPHGPERERVRSHQMLARKGSQDTFQEGDAAANRGDLELAEKLYWRALEIYPLWGRMQYEVHSHVATVYSMQGRVQEAAHEYLLALNSFRNYPACYFIANGVGYGPVRRSVTGTVGPGEGAHVE